MSESKKKKRAVAKHVRGGNCWVAAKNDVCMKHEEPRGECSECPRCPACEKPEESKTSSAAPAAPEWLPEGWTIEAAYGDTGAYSLIHSAPPHRYMATIDWVRRCVRTGMSVSGRPIAEKSYRGRGWREAITRDAVAHLRSIIASYEVR
jgi:hypothetical protein